MLYRADFYTLKGNLEEENINIGEIPYESDKAIDFLNAADLSSDIPEKLDWIIQGEEIIKSVLNMIIAKISPYINDLVELDNKKGNNFKNLKVRMENFFKDLDKRREALIKKVSIQGEPETNFLASKLTLQSHHSYLERIIREFILRVLVNAYVQYTKVDSPALISFEEDEKTGKRIKRVQIIPDKDAKSFWYCVYFFFVEVAQTNLPVLPNEVQVKPLELSDYQKLSGESSNPQQIEQTPPVNNSPPKTNTEEKKESTESNKKEELKEEGESEEEDAEDEDDSDEEDYL